MVQQIALIALIYLLFQLLILALAKTPKVLVAWSGSVSLAALALTTAVVI